MTDPNPWLFPSVEESRPRESTGLLPSQSIRRMRDRRLIWARDGIEETQIQPASLDLRLGDTAYRVQASFLPGRSATVEDKVRSYAMQKIDLSGGALLERGAVYVVKLMEELRLTKDVYGIANPKSSIGRLNVFTRLITDYGTEFDRVKPGYQGPLYAEIAPLVFSIITRSGSKLTQVRFKRGRPHYGEERLRQLHQQVGSPHGEVIVDNTYRGAYPITVEARGSETDGLIGYKARKSAPAIDIDRRHYYSRLDYWEEIHARPENGIILNPDDFYILASKEPVTVPPDHAAEMVAYDTLVGEFRVHYAGFFDPAFGHEEGGGVGTRAVLEVRSHEVAFMVEDGQTVGRLIYEPLAAPPDKVYSACIGSAYQKQGLTLSRHFKDI